ncbi:class I SAM-dependent DNA methyltransferase [Agrobacterium larrymoorei]|uniref:class I SAM-dependent DNA methyltransferase n=1 Tax=Agrobacterium larrymoorei TaxID=160699 RepID=UPI0030C18529
MSAFSDYAQIYDLLNEGKDYAGEAEFVERLIRDHAPAAKSILNFGCGTGSHDLLLAEKGFHTHGVELSSAMLMQAKTRSRTIETVAGNCRFSLGDLREFRAGETYDVVTALFHVFSYQTTLEDVVRSLETFRAHMSDSSVAIFDLWHGPAVQATPPEVRIRRGENQKIKVTRIAEPDHDIDGRVVCVNFTFFVEDKASGSISTFREKHPMRYFFPEEIEIMTLNAGMKIDETGAWLSHDKPTVDSWGVYYILRAA